QAHPAQHAQPSVDCAGPYCAAEGTRQSSRRAAPNRCDNRGLQSANQTRGKDFRSSNEAPSMDLCRILCGRQTRNRDFAAREPLSCVTKSCVDRSWNRHPLPFSRILWVASGPNPDLAAFDGKLPAYRDAMRHLEARAVKLGDLGGDVRHIVELGGSEKAGLGVDQRYSDDSERHGQLVRFHLQRFLEKTPHAPNEIFEGAAVEHDASRVAMTPFDRELPAEDEIGHARFRFPLRRHKSPPARRMSNRPKHACGTYGSDANARQEQSREGPAAFCQRP